MKFSLFVSVVIFLAAPLVFSEEASKKQKKKRNRKAFTKLDLPVVNPVAELNRPDVHEDFPAMCLNGEGKPVVAYIEHNGKADSLKLATLDADGSLKKKATISAPDIDNIYQPCLTNLPNGRLLCVWSQLEPNGQWDLMARTIGRKGLAALGKVVRLTEDPGNDIFPDLATDSAGNLQLVWQRMKNGRNQIIAKRLPKDSDSWSNDAEVTDGAAGGDWEPRLAFAENGDALIVFDSYRNGDFDVFCTRFDGAKTVGEPIVIAATDRYEARPAPVTSTDGKTLWITYEDGIKLWGKDLGADWRKKGGGLHHDRQLKVVKVDLATNEVEKVADITPLLPDLVADPTSVGTGAIDVPEMIVDAEGFPWVFFRYCLFRSPGYWQIACSRLNPESLEWTKPELVGKSSFCLDRRSSIVLHPGDGSLKLLYPGDLRKNKQAGNAGIFLASLDPGAERESVGALPFDLVKEAKSALKPWSQTPERDRSDHHTWEFDGKTYQLFWGDVHRHTDFSNCRTTDDGCITEHYRYAIEAGGLDFLGTSDHTEVGKKYTAYEWWQTQKLADLFHNPGSFVSIYAYEREQKFPYGHRNVLFEKRGGPVVYIKRKNYSESPWATPLPEPDGDLFGDIPPWQLWDMLRAHGKRAITIPHTTVGGMGTNWSKYTELNRDYENVIEVFQGSRNSSEGDGAPQPAVVIGREEITKYNEKEKSGSWQNALKLEHRLGAFASSDHRSTNLSYGGVYVTDFSRKGVFDAMDARRTTAATDKIYMEFSCNGHMMGEIFTTSGKPAFKMAVDGTAAIRRVTIVRNEANYQVYKPESKSNKFAVEYTDENPVKGENRYYLRVEQVDGNMGWTSPVWVTVE